MQCARSTRLNIDRTEGGGKHSKEETIAREIRHTWKENVSWDMAGSLVLRDFRGRGKGKKKDEEKGIESDGAAFMYSFDCACVLGHRTELETARSFLCSKHNESFPLAVWLGFIFFRCFASKPAKIT